MRRPRRRHATNRLAVMVVVLRILQGMWGQLTVVLFADTAVVARVVANVVVTAVGNSHHGWDALAQG